MNQPRKDKLSIIHIKKHSWRSILFLGVFFVIGIVVLITSAISFYQGQASKSWPMVTGKILSSEVLEHYDNDDGDYYTPSVTYKYQVEGKSYTGNRRTFAGERAKYNYRAVEYSLQKNYPVGAEVAVFYDPDEPETCTLEIGYGEGLWVWALVGLMFTGISCFVAFSEPGRPKRIR